VNATRLLAMSAVAVLLGAAVLFAVESGGGTPAAEPSGAQPVGAREIGAPVKVCVSNVEVSGATRTERPAAQPIQLTGCRTRTTTL
jgi:hypothetical protein